MHPALFLLLRLRRRALVRKTLSGLKTVRGALLLMVTAGLLLAFVLPQLLVPVLSAVSPEAASANRQMVAAATPVIRTLGPLFLLMFAIFSVATSWGEAAIYFTPPEVDFLFAAPFTRRELLYFKLLKSMQNAVVAGSFFGLVGARYAPSFLSAWLGSVLVLLFINAFTLAGTLLSQAVSAQAYTRSRQIILAAVILLIGLGLFQVFPYFDPHNFLASAELFRQSAAGSILLAPFEVFPRIVSAESFAELLLWSAIGMGMIGGLFALAVSLDVNYLERLQRMRQGGGGAIGAIQIRGAQRLRIPRLPWLLGIGPNLWRQWLLLMRRSQGIVFVLLFIVVGGVAMLMASRQEIAKHQYLIPFLIVGGIVYQSLIVAIQLPAAFRGDLDRMDWLKSLPISPSAVVWGEIIGVVLLLSLLQGLTLVAAWALYGGAHEVFAAGVVFLLPINLLVFGIENLIFLIFPMRMTPTTAGDFQFLGKYLLLTMLKMGTVCVCLAIVAAGAVLYVLIPNLSIALSFSMLLLVTIDIVVLYLATVAFLRFDVSRDTPT
jgi:ABC-2 type transport system permease protein